MQVNEYTYINNTISFGTSPNQVNVPFLCRLQTDQLWNLWGRTFCEYERLYLIHCASQSSRIRRCLQSVDTNPRSVEGMSSLHVSPHTDDVSKKKKNHHQVKPPETNSGPYHLALTYSKHPPCTHLQRNLHLHTDCPTHYHAHSATHTHYSIGNTCPLHTTF